jgi:hypothetical protein
MAGKPSGGHSTAATAHAYSTAIPLGNGRKQYLPLESGPVEALGLQPITSPLEYMDSRYESADSSYETLIGGNTRRKTTLWRRPAKWTRICNGALAGWGLEYGALLISMLSLETLLVVLAWSDGIALSAWTFYFSINTVVSILSGIMKAPIAFLVGSCLCQARWSWAKRYEGSVASFVAFDDASRGPLGAISLLWRLKSW